VTRSRPPPPGWAAPRPAPDGPAAAATISGNIDFFVGLLFSAARAIEQKQPLVGFATTLDQYGSTIVVSREVVDKHKLTEKTPIEQRLDALKGLRIASFILYTPQTE
jgi:hypothetical protein